MDVQTCCEHAATLNANSRQMRAHHLWRTAGVPCVLTYTWSVIAKHHSL
jgi:hypothetical protein